MVGVVEEAEDAAALAGDGDADGGVGGATLRDAPTAVGAPQDARHTKIPRADDVAGVGVDDAAVADDGDPLGGAG